MICSKPSCNSYTLEVHYTIRGILHFIVAECIPLAIGANQSTSQSHALSTLLSQGLHNLSPNPKPILKRGTDHFMCSRARTPCKRQRPDSFLQKPLGCLGFRKILKLPLGSPSSQDHALLAGLWGCMVLLQNTRTWRLLLVMKLRAQIFNPGK